MSARGEPPRKKVCRSVMSCATGDAKVQRYDGGVQHSKLAFKSMRDMWQSGELCDLTLLVGSRSFPVHKVVVSSCVPFLRAMLCSGMKESRQEEVRLHEIDELAMECIVGFCYSGSMDITPDTVYQVVAAANLLQMDEVKKICCDFLEARLTPENCLSTRCFADLHDFMSLVDASEQYAFKNFEAVVSSEEFVQCDINIARRLLDHEVVQAPSEECIFFALVRWVEFDRPARQAHVLELLKCIRFASLLRGFIENTIVKSDVIKETPACEAFLQGVLAAHVSEHTKVRLPPVAIYVVGGRNTTHCLDSCERYNYRKKTWMRIASMKQVRTAVTVAQLNGFIYAIGGERETQYSQYGTSYLNSVERFDVKSNVWETVAPLKNNRSFAASAVLLDKIYVIGGEDGSNFSLLSVEVYDPAKDVWTDGPQLNMRRSGPGCCVLNNKIYVVGGCTSAAETYHTSVEVLVPPFVKSEDSSCHWTVGKSMGLARSGVAVCALNGKIYACGGRNRSQSIYYKAVECYDTETKEWEHLAPMHMKRAWAGCVVCDDVIYIFGGYDGSERLDSVEAYDMENDVWTMVETSMEFQRAGCAAIVL